MGKGEITTGDAEISEIGIWETKSHSPSQSTHLLDWATQSLQGNVCNHFLPAAEVDPLWNLLSLYKMYSRGWGHCCLTRLVLRKLIWKLENARHLYIFLKARKLWEQQLLLYFHFPISQIPFLVNSNLKPIRKWNYRK